MMPLRTPLTMMLSLGLIAMNASAFGQDASRLPFQRSEPQAGSRLKAGANSFTESQARQLLGSKGYSDISKLMIDADGVWRGAARKGDRRLDVSVDFQGHIAEQ